MRTMPLSPSDRRVDYLVKTGRRGFSITLFQRVILRSIEIHEIPLESEELEVLCTAGAVILELMTVDPNIIIIHSIRIVRSHALMPGFECFVSKAIYEKLIKCQFIVP
ncbi:hypothetical protein Tco_0153186 [Tanacetum coccineum]